MQAFSVDADSTKKLGVRAPGCAVDPGTPVEDVLVTGDLKVAVAENQNTKKDPKVVGGIHKRWTGESFAQSIAVSNTAATKGQKFRVFFKFTDNKANADAAARGYVVGGNGKLSPGNKYYQTPPDKNPFWFKQVEGEENLYYIELESTGVGDTFTIPVFTSFDSPVSAGGSVEVWGQAVPADASDKAPSAADAVPTCGVHKATWDTTRIEYQAKKELVGKGHSDGSGGTWPASSDPSIGYDAKTGRYFIKDLRYVLKDAGQPNSSAPKGKIGQDPAVKWTYTDTFTIPDGLEINQDLLQGISKVGTIQTWNSRTPGWGDVSSNYSTIGKDDNPAIGIYGYSTYYDKGDSVSYEINSKQIKITYVTSKGYRNEEERKLRIRFADNFLLVKQPDGWDTATQGAYAPPAGAQFKVSNKLDVKTEYSHSDPAKSDASVDTTVTVDGPRPVVTKSHPNGEKDVYRRGDPINFTITAKNEGSGPWIVNEGEPDEGKIVDRLPGAYYVSPAQMYYMFATSGGDRLTISIDAAQYCDATIEKKQSSSGKEVTPSAGMAQECSQSTQTSYVLKKNQQGKIEISRDGGSAVVVENTPKALGEALKKLVAVDETRYTLAWDVPYKTIYGGQNYTHVVRATIKDQFMAKSDLSAEDTTNKVNLTGPDVPDKVDVQRDFEVTKSAYAKNKKVEQKGVTIPAGTVVDYELTVKRAGGKADYAALPMVDELSGAQILLVPANQDNAHLGEPSVGLTKKKINGIDYYVLDKPGAYKNVVFTAKEDAAGAVTEKKFIADTIKVEKLDSNRGIKTTTFWFMASQDFKNPSTVTVGYKTLTDPERTDYLPSTPGHPDAINLGGIKPPKYSITDKTEMNLSKLSAQKTIVTKRGKTPSEDATVSSSVVNPGSEVTYRLAIAHIGTEPFKLKGSDIYDALPRTGEGWLWNKENVHIEVPAQSSLKQISGSLNDWSLSNKNPASGQVEAGQQYIVWPDTFEAELSKTVYLYVQVKFPEAGTEWAKYKQTYSKSTLYNTWHVKDANSSVSHYLGGESSPVLQKGVVATGTVKEDRYIIDMGGGDLTATFQALLPDPSSSGRVKYYNSVLGPNDTYEGMVQYYAVIHNDGESRLYLNPVQDKLPKGFKFVAGISDENKIPKERCKVETPDNFWGEPCKKDAVIVETDNEGPKVDIFKQLNGIRDLDLVAHWQTNSANVPVSISGSDSVPKKASVHTAIDNNDPQRVTFSFDNSITGSNLAYDEVRGKYYLNAGETLAFEYYAAVGEEKYTEDIAKNGLVMPYDNFDGRGAKTNNVVKISAKPQEANPTNDGDRNIIDTATANQEGYAGGDDNTQWLASEVKNYRENNTVPGVSKKLLSKTSQTGTKTDSPATATYSDTLTWQVKAYNDSGQPITDYVISDVLDKGYVFTGDVRFENLPGPTTRHNQWNPERYKLFSFGNWEYDSQGNPKAVYLNIRDFAFRDIRQKLIVNPQNSDEERQAAPITVVGQYGNATYHVSIDTVEDGKLRLNVRVLPGTGDQYPPGRGYSFAGTPLKPYATSTLEVSAVNPKKSGDYRMTYNRGYVTLPSNKYSPGSVIHGSNTSQDLRLGQAKNPNSGDIWDGPHYGFSNRDGRFYNNKVIKNIPSVVSEAVVPIAQDAYTSSGKSVEEKAKPENNTNSNNETNFIMLPNQDSEFTYTLQVTNNKNDPLKQMTLIDNLAELSDKYTFGQPPRHSEFKVDFADDPNVRVETKTPSGDWQTVDASKYKVEFSDKSTGFTEEDWAATSVWGGKTASSRSIRVRIDDAASSNYTIDANTAIRVRFDAKVAAGQTVKPGSTAWNTFGYSYLEPGSNLTLQAIPLKVGVRVPNVVKLQKSVIDAENKPLTLNTDKTYRFAIYEGEPLSANELENKALGDALTERKRTFTVVDVTVPANKSQSDEVVIGAQKIYSYANGEWQATETDWAWQAGKQYQLVEIPNSSGTKLMKFTVSNGVDGEAPTVQSDHLTFAYENGKSLYFTAVNKQDKWQIDLKKVDGDACKTDTDCKALPGATFGLYSTDKSEAMAEAEVNAIGADVPATKDYNGTTYYLAKTKVSGADGAVTFDGLNGDKYFVAELKAPSGYGATWAGWEFTKPAGGQNPAATVVKNYGTYILPKSGGIGTVIFTVTGVLLVGGAALGFLYRRRNREDD